MIKLYPHQEEYVTWLREAMRRNNSVALEVKMPGKKVLKDQQNFLGVIESFSGFSKVVRSATFVWSVSA